MTDAEKGEIMRLAVEAACSGDRTAFDAALERRFPGATKLFEWELLAAEWTKEVDRIFVDILTTLEDARQDVEGSGKSDSGDAGG